MLLGVGWKRLRHGARVGAGASSGRCGTSVIMSVRHHSCEPSDD